MYTILYLLSFNIAGTILSSAIVAFSLGLNYLTCYWLFETQARAVQQTYVRNQIAEEDSEAIDAARDALLSDVSGDVLTPESDEMAVMDIIDLPNPLNCWVTLEVVELVDIFLGACLVALLQLAIMHTVWHHDALCFCHLDCRPRVASSDGISAVPLPNQHVSACLWANKLRTWPACIFDLHLRI